MSSTVLFSFSVLPLPSVYALTQSGSATSGEAKGGAAISGSPNCYNCNNYYYGGSANSGAATSGKAIGSEVGHFNKPPTSISSITPLLKPQFIFWIW
jgi:hypothetical protein